jgi:hypothetical protein
MIAATVHALPVSRPEAFTIADITDMLALADDHLSSHRVECAPCRQSATGVCRGHDEDDRLAFLAATLSDGLKAAGPHVIAELLSLGRTARNDRVPACRALDGMAAVSGEGGTKS